MKCIVPNCTNDSKHIFKTKGISFHVLPAEHSTRDAWLKAIGKEEWVLDKKSAVCSKHFHCDDLYFTQNGARQVKARAIPTASLFCRICLAMDVRLLSMKKYQLEEEYEHLTGISMSEDTFPQYLCIECAYRVLNFVKLRSKSLRAHSLMCEIVKRKRCLSNHTIKIINRESNELSTQLKPKIFESNHADYVITNTEIAEEFEDTVINEFSFESDVQEKGLELTGNTFESNHADGIITNMHVDGFEGSIKIEFESDSDVEEKELKVSNKVVKSDSALTTFEEENVKCEPNYDMYMNDTDCFDEEGMDKLKFEDDKNNEIIMLNENDDENNLENSESNFSFVSDKVLKKIGFDVESDNIFRDNNCLDDNNTDVGIHKDEELYIIIADNDYLSDDSSDPKLQKSTEKIKELQEGVKEKYESDYTDYEINRTKRASGNPDLTSFFTVFKLTKEEQFIEFQKRKESINYRKALLKCDHCFRGFKHIEAFNNHMMKHSNQYGEYLCDICKVRFKLPRFVRKHIAEIHLYRYSCNKCPFITNHGSSAELHRKWHMGTRYFCPHCPSDFVRLSTYMSHVRIKHPSDFACQLCGYSFVGEKGIIMHKKLKHRTDNTEIPADGPYCEECDIRFLNEEALEKHLSVSTKHTDGDPDATRRRAINAYKYKTYKARPEEGEKGTDGDGDPFAEQIRRNETISCEQCDMQLADYRAYHVHFIRRHRDKTRTKYRNLKYSFICEVCGKRFGTPTALGEHATIHTGEKAYKCETCGKSFRQKIHLMAHSNMHNATKPRHGCSVCGKHFVSKGNMLRHMLIHTGHKPYKCEMCDKSFIQSNQKRMHIEYFHMKKPWPKRVRGKRKDRNMRSEAGVSATERNS